MKTLSASLVAVVAVFMNSASIAHGVKPTIVLVHAGFADASSWNSVIKILDKDGYPAVAVANPTRSVQGDAKYVTEILAGIKSPSC